MTPIRIFLSSPGDVAQERRIAGRVIERLDAEFPAAKLEPYFWEYEPMVITKDYQEQIPPPSGFDIVICILWSRMGSRMHTKYKREDGGSYRSGTEYEFVDAVEGQRRNEGTPDVLVWINKTQPLIPLEPEEMHMERLRQWRELKAFLEEWTRDGEEQTFKGAVNRYARLDEFEEKLEVKLRKLVNARLEGDADADGDGAEVTWTKGSPFRGLEAFDFEHAPVFFGRTAAVAEAIDSLRRQGHERGSSFLMVAGASGSGKSSLVRAGVLPMLIEPGVIEGIGLWRRAVLRPGDGEDPFSAVAAALLAPEALPEIASDGTSADELAAMLRDSPEAALGLGRGALSHAAAMVHADEKAQLEDKIAGFQREGRGGDADSASKRLEGLAPPRARLALVIDQFEEIFGEKVEPEARTKFVGLVAALAASGRVFVIATIRSDFFPRCADFSTLLELTRGDGMLQLGPPTPAELGQMIRQPAQSAGLVFESDPSSGESLDEVLRDAAVEQPTVLPLLGFCLQQLYEGRVDGRRLSFDAYRALGGVEGAVARRAEEVYLKVSDAARAEFPRLIRAAVTVGGFDEDAVTRRRAGYEALASSKPMKELIDALVAARLFVADTDESGRAMVGVAHEALLRCWPRMADAIAEDREFLRARARIARSAKRWNDDGEHPGLLLPSGKQLEEGREMLAGRADEIGELERRFIDRSSETEQGASRQRLRRLQFVAGTFGLLAIAAGGAGIYAFKQRARAEERRAETAELLAGADSLINSTLYDLRDKLTLLGRTDLLEGVSKNAETYFASIPADLLSDDTERQYGTLLNWRGDSLAAVGQNEAAREKYEASLEIARRRFEEDPAGDQRARDLSINLGKLAQLSYAEGDLDTTEALYREIGALPWDEDHPLAALDRVSVFSNLGDVLRDRGDWRGAAELYEKAVDSGKDVVFEAEFRAAARNVPAALDRLAAARRNLGEMDTVAELTARSLEITETLVERFPDELLFRNDLVGALGRAARVAGEAGDAALAIERADRALEIARGIHAEDPQSIVHTKQLLYAFSMAGSRRMTEESETDPDLFGVFYEESVPLARRLFETAPEVPEHATLLSTHLDGLALAQELGGGHAAAIETASEAIAALDSVEAVTLFVRRAYEASYTRFWSAHAKAGTPQGDLVPAIQHALRTSYRFRAAGLGDDQLEANIEQARAILEAQGAEIPEPE